MTKTIITHNSSFHCDELSAIALLHVFTPDSYSITRVPHQSESLKADFTIDIGRQYNSATGHFDHHQWEGGKSSAGLIWEYLNLSDAYPKISDVVDLIDQNDVGTRKASAFELPRIISAYNTDDIYDDEIQLAAFHDALMVLITIFTSMKKYADDLAATETAIENATQLGNIVIADKHLTGWESYLNGKLTPSIRAIAWPKLDGTIEWCAQVIPVKPGNYELHGKRFNPSPTMTFVHATGFFCVAPNKQTMLEYLT